MGKVITLIWVCFSISFACTSNLEKEGFVPIQKKLTVEADYFSKTSVYLPKRIQRYQYSYTSNLIVSRNGDSLEIIAFEKGLGKLSVWNHNDTLVSIDFDIKESIQVEKAQALLGKGDRFEILNNTYANWITHLKKINQPFSLLKFPLSIVVESNRFDSINVAKLIGNIVIINFWYFGCPPCMEEANEIRSIANNMNLDDELKIIYVNKDSSYKRGRNHFFWKEFYQNGSKISSYDTFDVGPVIYAYGGKFYEEQLSFSGYPLTLVIDKKGTLRQAISGGLRKGYLQEQIELLTHLN